MTKAEGSSSSVGRLFRYLVAAGVKAVFIGLLALDFCVAPIRAEDTPKEPVVSALTGLLGHNIADKAVQYFVGEQRLQKYNKFDSGGYARTGDETETYALLFRGNVICRVIIDTKKTEGIASPYRGTLPGGVHASDSFADVRRRLGPPKTAVRRKEGSSWLTYARDGQETTYVFENDRLYEIDIDTPRRH